MTVSNVFGFPTLRNEILGNNIFANGSLGIDLTNDGVTPNDGAGDPDIGDNGLQNFPALSFVASGALGTTIQGSLTSLSATSFRIEAFSNPACDGSGNGEGTSWLGFDTTTTDAFGTGAFSLHVPTVVPLGAQVTTTATGPEGTSEFSACATVAACAYSVFPGTVLAQDKNTLVFRPPSARWPRDRCPA